MGFITKTLTTNISNSNYPTNYTWSCSCPTIVFGTQIGILNNAGAVSTTITYDDTICYYCDFTISLNDNLTCFGTSNGKDSFSLNCGQLSFLNNSPNTATVSIISTTNTFNITLLTNQNNHVNTLPFGNYNVTINSSCSPLMSNVTVNGLTQTGSGSIVFTLTTDINNPSIDVVISCI